MQVCFPHLIHLADLLMVTGLSSPQGHLSGLLETGTFADAPAAKPDVPAAKPDVPACEFIEIATTNGPELVTVITVEVAG